MLVQKLKINKLQFTQHRKLKKEEDLRRDLSNGSSEKRDKILTGATREAMCRAESEVKATQGVP